MSLGPLMIDIAGLELDAQDRNLLKHPLVGGVILFARNFASSEQVSELVRSIHALRETPLLVAVDQEGGRVQRFREGFTRLPPVADLGECYDKDARHARELAKYTGWLNAAELRSVGIDLSFAPVLDLDYGVSGVIGDRAFHRDPQIVAELARAYMQGMDEAGMAAVGKHFPGHGAIEADSHEVISIDKRRYADIRVDDMLPFERMIHYGLPAVMVAHIVYPACDDQAAGFSRFWLQDVLRGELEFKGAIFSDDLSMKGAAVVGNVVDRARASLSAGCDMVLVCNDRPAAIQALDELTMQVKPASNARLLALQGRPGFPPETLRSQAKWHNAARAVESYSLKETLDLDM